MKTSRFTDSQIIAILKQSEAGTSVLPPRSIVLVLSTPALINESTAAGSQYGPATASVIPSPISSRRTLISSVLPPEAQLSPWSTNRTGAPSSSVMLGLAAEAIRVGAALEYATEDIFGLSPDVWLRADGGETDTLAEVTRVMRAQHELLTEDALSGTSQDLSKGKPTEVDFMNGFVAAKAMECGVSAPLHAEVAAILRKIEQGHEAPGSAHLKSLARLTA